MAYACTTYSTSWVGNNALIILIGFAVLAVIYLISSPLQAGIRARVKALVRREVIQLFISMMIIVVLIGGSALACQLTTLISPNQDPFGFALTYVQGLITGPNGGISLLTNLYSYSYGYAIISGIFQTASGTISSFIKPISLGTGLTLSFPFGYALGIPYTQLSDLLLGVLSPITVIATGLMYLQYIMLIVAQGTAFTIVLPIALIVRSVTLTGSGIRNAADAILAIAIASYIIYPVTVVFDSYTINWIQTTCGSSSIQGDCNPSASFLNLNIVNTQNDGFFSSSSLTQCVVGQCAPNINSILGPIVNNFPLLDPAIALATVIGLVDTVALYVFTTIVMLTINIIMTLGFAIALAKSLDAGIEGAGSFWSSFG